MLCAVYEFYTGTRGIHYRACPHYLCCTTKHYVITSLAPHSHLRQQMYSALSRGAPIRKITEFWSTAENDHLSNNDSSIESILWNCNYLWPCRQMRDYRKSFLWGDRNDFQFSHDLKINSTRYTYRVIESILNHYNYNFCCHCCGYFQIMCIHLKSINHSLCNLPSVTKKPHGTVISEGMRT